jgi:rhamnosyltransferase
MTVALIIPTYNAEKEIPYLFRQIQAQTLQPDFILVIDSSSKDNTRELLAQFPIMLYRIPQHTFDHGGTRKLATQLLYADNYIYLTQDAIPADDHSFQNLIAALEADPKIGCAYGRQLPKSDATPLGAHARLFNYPENSVVRSFADIKKYGIKTCFNSDSFAAYKRTALELVGNFPDNLITGEDAFVAAQMLRHGLSVAYAADASVFHSHNLSLREEFHRYFSIGVFHKKEQWLLKDFNSATGEGLRFVKSELSYLIGEKHFSWIPHALASSFVKFLAYKLGFNENKIPFNVKSKIGINKAFWLNQAADST